MQFLVTERKYFDFILYAENRPFPVERIELDEQLIKEILQLLTTFWKRVIIAPELTQMCVPRNLMPFVLPDMENHHTNQTLEMNVHTLKMKWMLLTASSIH